MGEGPVQQRPHMKYRGEDGCVVVIYVGAMPKRLMQLIYELTRMCPKEAHLQGSRDTSVA